MWPITVSPEVLGCFVKETCIEKSCVVQRDLTSSWAPYLPSLPTYLSGLWPRPSAILEIAIDSERNILYTRSQNSSIQVGTSSYAVLEVCLCMRSTHGVFWLCYLNRNLVLNTPYSCAGVRLGSRWQRLQEGGRGA
jgi:hypothetical protein